MLTRLNNFLLTIHTNPLQNMSEIDTVFDSNFDNKMFQLICIDYPNNRLNTNLNIKYIHQKLQDYHNLILGMNLILTDSELFEFAKKVIEPHTLTDQFSKMWKYPPRTYYMLHFNNVITSNSPCSFNNISPLVKSVWVMELFKCIDPEFEKNKINYYNIIQLHYRLGQEINFIQDYYDIHF